MTLSALAKKLRSQVRTTGSFSLDDDTLGTSTVDALISRSPLDGSSITMSTDTVPDPSGDTLTITGAHVSMLSLKGMSATVTFRKGTDGLVFTLRAAMPENWTLGMTFPAVKGSRAAALSLEQATLVFTTEGTENDNAPVSEFVNGLNLEGTVDLDRDGPFALALTLFEKDAPPTLTLKGPIRSSGHGPVFTLRALLPEAAATLGPVSLEEGFVGMALAYEQQVNTVATGAGKDATLKTSTSWVATPTLEVGAHVAVGDETFVVTADLNGGSRIALTLSADHGLASLSDLSALLGASSSGKEWEAMLPDELKQLGGFALQSASIIAYVGSSIRVESIDVGVGLNEWTLLDGEVTARDLQAVWTVFSPGGADSAWEIYAHAQATFGSGKAWTFDLEVDLPSLDVTGDLVHEEGRTAPIGGLVRDVLPGTVHVPDDLGRVGIAEASFEASPSMKHLHLYATGAVDFEIYGESNLGVDGITFTFDYDGRANTASGTLAGELSFGAYAFDVSAQIGEDMRIEGALPKRKPVTVVPFLEAVTDQRIRLPDAVPNFTVEALTFTADTASKSFTFSGDVTTHWRLPLGAARPAIEVDFSVDSSVEHGTRTFQGSVEGTLDIGQRFDVRYEFGDHVSVLTGTWRQSGKETIDYKDIGTALNISTSHITEPTPGMPDLGLARADLTVDFAHDTVALDAETDRLGGCSVLVRASKGATVGAEVTDKGWGFLFGVALNEGWTFSDLPKLGSSLKAFDFISFKNAALVIATRREKVTGKGFPLLPDVSMEMKAGLNFGAHIDFSGASKQGTGRVANLQYLLGGDDVFLQGRIGRTLRQTEFEAALEGSVSLPISKSDVRLADPFVRVKILNTGPSLSLGGHLKLPIPSEQRRPPTLPAAPADTNEVDIEGYFQIDVEEADFTVNARFDGDVDHPVGFQGVVLTDIGGTIGLGFEPVGVECKLLAQFQIRTPEDPKPRYTSSDEFAFVFNVNPEEYFYPEYLYVKMSILDLYVLFAALVPNVELPPSLGSGIRFTNTFVYFCDEPNVQLPDGTTAQAGFGFNGDVHVFDVFEGDAGVMVTREQMHGDFEMTPVHLDLDGETVLSITGQTSSGGPTVAFNTKQSPYLDVTADIHFLSLNEAVDVYLGDDKFTFAFQYTLVGEAALTLSCAMTKKGAVHASGRAGVNLDLTLDSFTTTDGKGNDVTVIPKAHVASDSAAIDVSLDAQAPSKFSLSGRLDVHWHSIHLSPHFTLTLQDIEHDLHNLWQAVVSWIKSNLEAFYHAVLNDIDMWVHLIETEFADFAGEADKVARALIHYFDAVADDVARVLHDLEHDFLTIVQTLLKHFELQMSEAIQIVKKYFGRECSSTLAYRAVMGQKMRRQGPYYLAELARTEGGQPLLVHYYRHEDELRTLLLGHTPGVERRLRGHPDAPIGVGTSESAPPAFVTGVLAILDAVYPDASPELQDSIETVRPVLSPYRGVPFDEFLDALDENDAT